jgi:hypothetical protein
MDMAAKPNAADTASRDQENSSASGFRKMAKVIDEQRAEPDEHAGTRGGDDTPPFVAEAVFVVDRGRMRNAIAAHASTRPASCASSATADE